MIALYDYLLLYYILLSLFSSYAGIYSAFALHKILGNINVNIIAGFSIHYTTWKALAESISQVIMKIK